MVVERHVIAHLVLYFAILLEANAMHNVALHRVEEGLNINIIVHFARPIHALDEPKLSQPPLERSGRKFDSAVAVEDQAARWAPPTHRPIKRGQSERDILLLAIRPAQDAARVLSITTAR